MASVFDYVFIMQTKKGEGWNYMITAGDNDLDFSKLTTVINNNQLADIAQQVSVETEPVKFNPDKMVLTDDRSPIDIMTEKMIFRYLVDNIF